MGGGGGKGKGKAQTIGYWYRPLIHFGFCQGEADALLEFRGGDRTAWRGELAESQRFYVNAMELWGGEASEGGIAGYCDWMAGEATQEPNEFLATYLGERQPAYRGVASLVFRGGRYGAMNPYPKPASFWLRRILKGWDNDDPWYPARAAIEVAGVKGGRFLLPFATGNRLYRSVTGALWPTDQLLDTGALFVFGSSGQCRVSQNGGATFRDFGPIPGAFSNGGGVVYAPGEPGRWTFQSKDGAQIATSTDLQTVQMVDQVEASNALALAVKDRTVLMGGNNSRFFRSTDGGAPGTWERYYESTYGDFAAGHGPIQTTATQFVSHRASGNGFLSSATGAEGSWDFEAMPAGLTSQGCNGSATGNGYVVFLIGVGTVTGGIECAMIWREVDSDTWFEGQRFTRSDGYGDTNLSFEEGTFYYSYGGAVHRTTHPGEAWEQVATGLPGTLTRVITSGLRGDGALLGMNPAHIIYDSLVSLTMQGEPVESINQDSFEAAADKLWDEQFGLCTTYDPDAETVEEFRQRICNLIGARCSRSRVDGLWYLDLIRGDYDIDELPILTDMDLLSLEEEPPTIDDAVNQVSVEWFDQIRKASSTTAPVQSLGAIQAMGVVNPEVGRYPEIPVENLALRVAARDLRNKSPLKRFRADTNRVPYAWRIGTFFRLQAPKKGIADMVCMVGDIDTGTLRSGAIRMVFVQSVFSMPEATYLVGERGDPGQDLTPRGSPQQRVVELPYVELAATLPSAELAALAPEAGYIAAIATRPSVGLNYALYTKTFGTDYGGGQIGDWCPACTFEEPSGFAGTVFTVAAQSQLASVEVGTRGMWELEEVRVDAIDPDAGTVTLGRGVADTVPVQHAAGTVCYFYDNARALDGVEYVEEEEVFAKLLTRTGTAFQDPNEAPELSLIITGRASRPYPPARLRINDAVAPAYASGEITVTWAHRDRLAQADQLIDTEVASIGPEAGTTYTVRWYLDDVLEHTHDAVAGTSQAYTPSGDGTLRIELESVRDGVTSHQKHVRELAYTLDPTDYLETEGGELIRTEAGDPITLE